MFRVLGVLIFGFWAAWVIPAEETIPEAIRRPQQGEAPRYPQDTVIGSLGKGEASEEAYRFARNILGAVIAKNQRAAVLSGLGEAFLKNLFETLEPVNPQKFRLGGGREEPDGSVSFLVRLAGREQWITGELYLRFEEEQWKLDDLILEEPRDISNSGNEYRFDFSPYERFY